MKILWILLFAALVGMATGTGSPFLQRRNRLLAKLYEEKQQGGEGGLEVKTWVVRNPKSLDICILQNETLCGNLCVNTTSDVNNCGACGNPCGFQQMCCEGKCTNVLNDADRCGSCQRTTCRTCTLGMCDYNSNNNNNSNNNTGNSNSTKHHHHHHHHHQRQRLYKIDILKI